MSLVTTSTLRTGRAASAADSPAAPEPRTTTSTSRPHVAAGAASRLGSISAPTPHGRGGDGAGEQDAGTFGDESGGEGGLKHVSADTGVLADDDFVAVGGLCLEDAGNGAADAQGDFRGDRVFVRDSADAVSSK